MKSNLKSLVSNCIHALLLMAPKVTSVLVRVMTVVLIVSSLTLTGCKCDSKKVAPAKMGSITVQKADPANLGSVTLDVRDENGKPIAAYVRIFSADSSYDKTFKANGRLVVTGLKPGKYNTEVHAKKGSFEILQADQSKPHTFELTKVNSYVECVRKCDLMYPENMGFDNELRVCEKKCAIKHSKPKFIHSFLRP